MKPHGSTPPSAGSSPSGLKVLVVDDDPLMIQILERMLVRQQVEVITTHRAFGLMNLIAAHRPVLVLLDVNMPGLDGPSLVKLVRNDPEIGNTNIVLHSALEEEALARKAKQCGANGYIAKSRGFVHIEKSIQRWLGRSDA